MLQEGKAAPQSIPCPQERDALACDQMLPVVGLVEAAGRGGAGGQRTQAVEGEAVARKAG